MKLFNLAWIGLLALIFTPWTAAMPIAPEKCPSVSAIQETKFLQISKLPDGNYGAIQISNYDTEEPWGFSIYNIQASSLYEASAKAKAALLSLTYRDGPLRLESPPGWSCLYNSTLGKALAITPLPLNLINADVFFNAKMAD